MKKAVIILIATCFAVTVMGSSPGGNSSNVHWGYSGEDGPTNWGKLSDAYEMCGKGKNQSPIDIQSGSSTKLDDLQFHYASSRPTILNNGHTIQVTPSSGSYIIIGGERYELLQYHFHSPSEHTVKGHPYPIEAHFVHRDKSGRLAVIGVLMMQGTHHSNLKKIWDYMPERAGDTTHLDILVDPGEVLPADKTYFHYSGSLTTPPCSEGVRWFVLETPIEIARSQELAFLKVMGHPNARPTQPLNKRFVYKND